MYQLHSKKHINYQKCTKRTLLGTLLSTDLENVGDTAHDASGT